MKSLFSIHYEISFLRNGNFMKSPLFIISFFVGMSVFAQSTIPSAKKQEKPVALIGGTIHTVTGAVIENGTLVFDNGKITAIGVSVSVPQNAEKINVAGKHLYPGFIVANSILGLTEIDQIKATHDNAEILNDNSNVKAEVAYTTDSEYIPVSRANGVAYNVTTPNGGTIGGHAAVMKMDGWTWEDALVKSKAGLVINWPRMTVIEAWWMTTPADEQRKNIQKNIDDLNKIFDEAKKYREAKKAETDKGIPYHNFDSRMDQMISVLDNSEPVMIYASDVYQIESAISFCKKQNLKMILVGGKDSWLVTDLLKENNIPVVIGTNFDFPATRDGDYDAAFKLSKLLYDAGVKYCISTGLADNVGGETNTRNLPYEAALAVSFGLPKEEGLKSITIYPAQIYGLENRIGSLEVGKDATIVVTNGDPLEITTNVEMEFIDGKKIDLRSHHTMLRDKFTEKYNQKNSWKK